MTNGNHGFLVVALSLLIGCQIFSSASAAEPWTIHRSERFELDSAHVGDKFMIHVVLPRSYADEESLYKVVYVLDADLALGLVRDLTNVLPVDLIEPGFPELLLVGIGYPDPDMYCR